MDRQSLRQGRRKRRIRKRPSKRRLDGTRQTVRELYYVTQSLNNLVGAIVQLSIVGAACIITGILIARALYLLG